MINKFCYIFLISICFPLFSQQQSETTIRVHTLDNANCSNTESSIVVNVLEESLISNEIKYKQNYISNIGNKEISAFKTVDYDTDGDQDILVIATNYEGSPSSLYLYENLGSEGFKIILLLVNIRASSVDVYDFDTDGDFDLIVGSTLYENKGNNKFSSKISGISEAKHEVADFNDDGLLDLLLKSRGDILLNNMNESFTEIDFSIYTPFREYNEMYTADLDSDLFVDVIESADDYIVWHKNDGTANFNAVEIIQFETESTTNIGREQLLFSKALDYDKDGDVDIVTYIYRSNSYPQDSYTFALYTNDGDQNFTRKNLFTSNNFRDYIEVVDIDNDNDFDIVASGRCNHLGDYQNSRRIEVFYNNDETYTSTAPFGVTASLIGLSDLDGDGYQDILRVCNEQFSWFSRKTTQSASVYNNYSFSIDNGATFQSSNAFDSLDTGAYYVQIKNNVTGAQISYEGNPVVISEPEIKIDQVSSTPHLDCGEEDGTLKILASVENRFCYDFASVVQEGNDGLSYFVDLDQNGVIDIVSVNEYKRSIIWKENDGQGSFIPRQIYRRSDQADIDSILFTDIDNDGDIDIIGQTTGGVEFVSYNDGNQSFSNTYVSGFNRLSGDLLHVTNDWDMDGKIDLFSTEDKRLYLYSNDGDQTFTRVVLLDHTSDISEIILKDFNGDQKLDIVCIYNDFPGVGASLYINKGDSTFDKKDIFADNHTGAKSVSVSDIDNDTDLDIILSFINNGIKQVIYINDGNENFTEKMIANESSSLAASKLVSAIYDIDQDGFLDIITANSTVGTNFGKAQKLIWYRNKSGNEFEKIIINTNTSNLGIHSMKVTDIDIDGDLDILIGGTNGPFVYNNDCNTNRVNNDFLYSIDSGATYQESPEFTNLSSGEYSIKVKNGTCEASEVVAVTYSYNQIAIDPVVSENPSGCGVEDGSIAITASYQRNEYAHFDNETLITNDDLEYYQIKSIDFDTDGDIDIIAITLRELLFFENDGNNNYRKNFVGDIESINYSRVYPFYIMDFNNDGNLDIIASSSKNNDLFWFDRSDGKRFIRYEIDGGFGFPVDFENDGDIDIIRRNSTQAHIELYRNDGHQNFEEIILLDNLANLKGIKVLDVDGDGFLDILSNDYDDVFYFFKGLGNLEFESNIISKDTYQLYSKQNTLDANNDGDLDLISFVKVQYGTDKIVLKINNNTNQFEEITLTEVNYYFEKIIGLDDIDADGFDDVIFSSVTTTGVNNVQWIKNNGDGTFAESQILISQPTPVIITEDMNYDGIKDFVIADGGNITYKINQPISEFDNEALRFSIDGGESFQDSSVFTGLGAQQYYNIIVGRGDDACANISPANNLVFLSTTNLQDTDNDGILDELEDINKDCNFDNDDTDFDGIPNYKDTDDDNDGLLTYLEDFNQNGTPLDDDQDNDQIPDYLDSDSVLSTDDRSLDSSVVVYPNPARNKLFINTSLSNLNVRLLDIKGRIILEKNSIAERDVLDIDKLPSGIYILQISNQNNQIIKKIVKN